jgi:hypothetical protein
MESKQRFVSLAGSGYFTMTKFCRASASTTGVCFLLSPDHAVGNRAVIGPAKVNGVGCGWDINPERDG